MNKQEMFYLIFNQSTHQMGHKVTRRRLRIWYKDYGFGTWVFTGIDRRALIGIK